MPEISIIMNCFNGEKYLKEAIDSIYAQTYKNWEIILWDDASIDRTSEIAKSYDGKLKYFLGNKARGLGEARNNAIKRAGGKYIAFLDQDDVWYCSYLENHIKYLNNLSYDYAATFADCDFIDSDGQLIGFSWFSKDKPYNGDVFLALLLEIFFIPIQTIFIKKEVLNKIGDLSPELRIAEDMDLNLKLAYCYKIYYIPKVLAGYRLHSSNTSKDLYRLNKESWAVIKYWFEKTKNDRSLKAKIIKNIYFYKSIKMFYFDTIVRKSFSGFSYLRAAIKIYDNYAIFLKEAAYLFKYSNMKKISLRYCHLI